ncbi:MAG: GTPase, partial [Planctomycetota bacterium]
MKAALLGLPLSGKSTLFRLLTGSLAEAPRRPGVELRQAEVHDPRLERLARDYPGQKVIPVQLTLMDFPALVSGSQRTLAEQLAPAREADLLLLVLHSFENPAVPPQAGRIDPNADLERLLEELRLADFEIAEGRQDRARQSLKKPRPGVRAELQEELALLGRLSRSLEEGKEISHLELSAAEEKRLRGFQFLTQKPRVVIENLGGG